MFNYVSQKYQYCMEKNYQQWISVKKHPIIHNHDKLPEKLKQKTKTKQTQTQTQTQTKNKTKQNKTKLNKTLKIASLKIESGM